MQQLKINATKARQNLFSILDQIAKEDISFIITKSNLETPIIIKRANSMKNNQTNYAKQTAGALKGQKYKPNEGDLAKKHFIKTYIK